MKIGLLVDYYPPFVPGGSEWSIYYLSKQLQDRGIDSIIITINYGTKSEELINNIKVIRIPVFKKLTTHRAVINPIWQNNPIYFVISAFNIYQIARKENLQLLHVNGKYLIPGSWLAAKLLRIPIVVTIRDKQLLCSYGKCFFAEKRYQACNFWEYLGVDMFWFWQNYVTKKSFSAFIYVLLSAIYTRIANHLIKFFATRADQVIAISFSQKKYLEKNGFRKVKVIYNSTLFPLINKRQKKQGVIFAGKLSLGKGIYLLLEAIPEVLKKYRIKFYLAGGVDNRKKIESLIRELMIGNYVTLLGGIDHHKLQKLYQKSNLTVMPSIFPEAFGRVALESIAVGTPAVVVNKGGLPEIIESGITGEISQLNSHDLAQKIIKVLNNNQKYIKNISKKRNQLIRKFETDPINQHLIMYKKLI